MTALAKVKNGVPSMSPQIITMVLIALYSLVFIPGTVAVAKQFLIARREAKRAAIESLVDTKLSNYVSTKQHEEKFTQVRDYLDTIRSEAYRREGALMAAIKSSAEQVSRVEDRLTSRLDALIGSKAG
jgi:hypothetical protein